MKEGLIRRATPLKQGLCRIRVGDIDSISEQVQQQNMGIGAVLEPLIVVTLLFGGAWINRATDPSHGRGSRRRYATNLEGNEDAEKYLDEGNIRPLSNRNRSLSPSLLPSQEEPWRQRELRVLGWSKTVQTPNTAMFRNRLLSRVLHKFPFLVEAWYWALIYWVCHRALKYSRETNPVAGISARTCLHSLDNRRRNGPCC